MAEVTSYKPSSFSWTDYAANDTAAAIKFYSGLFGWEAETMKAESGDYTLMKLKGKSVAGLMEITPDMKAMNVPPCWTSYINVENADAAVAKAKENGGKAIFEAMDAMDAGRWGLVQDTDGAVFGVWEPKSHFGSAFKEEHGAICWFEHASINSEASVTFYQNVFGWTSKKENMGNMDYTTFMNDGEGIGGLYEITPEMKGVPPHWLPYFAINNIDIAIEYITSQGGKILMPKMHIENIGFFSVLQDPQGGAFGLVQG